MSIKQYLQTTVRKTIRLGKQAQAYPLVFILLGLIFGMVGYFEHLWVALGLALILVLRKRSLILSLSLVCGLFYSHLTWVSIDNDLRGLANTYVDIEATINEITNTSDFGQVVTLKIEEHFVLLTAKFDRYPTLTKHTRLQLHGKLKVVDEAFDGGYANYLKSKKIFFTVDHPTFQLIRNAGNEDPFYNFRQQTKEAINRNVNEPEASLINGILLGEKIISDQELKNSLVLSGTSHIVSISGYNFSLIYAAFTQLNKFIHIRIAQLLSILLIFSFMLVVGLENIPAQRATIMICFLACSKILGRRANLWLLLLLSLTLILIEFPLFYSNVSFQLTVFATVGLILITKHITLFFKRTKLPEWIVENIGTSFAALVATLPISYLSFQSVSMTGLVANIVILPFIPLLTWASILSAAFGLSGFDTIGRVFFHGVYILAKLVNALILFFGHYPVLIDSPSAFLATLLVILALFFTFDYYLQHEAFKHTSPARDDRKLSLL